MAAIQFTVDKLRVRILGSVAEVGTTAAATTAETIRRAVAERGAARVILATGNSQLAFIAALRAESNVPWDSVTVFHMDEYVGVDADHPASFQRWIGGNVADRFHPAAVHYLQGDTADPEQEALRYEKLLRAAPLDLVCMGIGENGHIAFNEPFQADFADERWVRVIELDDRSRKQQVGEGHFRTVQDVPRSAISLTVPALLAPAAVQVTAPEARKAEAVRAALTGPVSNACPATVLREHPNADLFLDRDSAALLDQFTG
ncbi:MAG TPA: glucosamine-6-phosphate deaminase [Mycobacteriales bacterium]|jgi:glucosamine-6-phosphate deaminase|nr:glucosamine-6-phosphate deaminase [Mycobacteriales bacterium]